MDILIIIVGFGFAVIIHEVAHGLMAERLGDPTARLMGRLTLNPIPHIDVFGSIILPLMLIVFRAPFIFGWAKPVPVDPYNLQHPKKDMALISLAGPLSNILMAIILSIFLRILLLVFPFANTIFNPFVTIIAINIALAVFNLIPVNPLDGGKILTGILPIKHARAFNQFIDKAGILLIFFLIFPIFGCNSLVTIIISPIITFFLRILLP